MASCNHLCKWLAPKMKLPHIRAVDESEQEHLRISLTARRAVACVFLIALILAMPVENACSSSSNSAIYSFGATQPLDGAVPKGSLTYVNELLFGRITTTVGTAKPPFSSGNGVIFHFNPSNVTATYSIDHVFGGDPNDGANPRHDAMTPLNNLLYGTTYEGGTDNTGIICDWLERLQLQSERLHLQFSHKSRQVRRSRTA
jgi:hypothetical protein